jgi:tetratricopeptide (TPR) repeat protein
MIEMLVTQINDLAESNKLHETEPLLDELLEIDPMNASAIHLKGVITGKRGNHKEAEALFSTALYLYNREKLYWANKITALMHQQKNRQALADANMALSFFPDDILLTTRKADALYNLSRYNEALKLYERVLLQRPRDLPVMEGKGLCLSSGI